MVSLSIVLKLKAKMDLVFLWARHFVTCNPICSFMFTIGSFRSKTRQICDAAGSNFSQKRLPAHARPFKFDASLSVQNASQRDLALWENVSINCPFLKTKRLRMYLFNLEFKTQIHVETFSRKFTLQTWQSWLFLTWYASYWGWRSEAKMDQKWLLLLQNYLEQVVPPSLSSLLFSVFTVVFAKRTPELAGTNRIWLFFHGSIFFKL